VLCECFDDVMFMLLWLVYDDVFEWWVYLYVIGLVYLYVEVVFDVVWCVVVVEDVWLVWVFDVG